MDYIKPMRCETVAAGSSETLIDTHGLAMLVKVTSGSIYITGGEDTLSDTSYQMSEGEKLCFGGTLKMKSAGGSSATVKILYFDAI